MNKPVLHQLKTDGLPLDGMSYVLETGDGRLIVIDGGMKNDVEYLYSYLKQLCHGENPTVDLWIITHAHADHTFAFIYMAEAHGHEMTVKKVMYRFPEEDFFQEIQPQVLPELAWMAREMPKFQGLQVISPTAGERYSFGDLTMEILYTCADLPSYKNASIAQCTNDTSLVFRFYYQGQSILFLGDVQAAGNRVLIDRYGAKLKSDVVQLAHHGEWSSTEEFYRLVDPQIVLWPVNMRHVNRLSCSLIPANRFIFHHSNAKAFVIAGKGSSALPLPLCADQLPGKEFLLTKRDPVPKLFFQKAKSVPELSSFQDEAWDGVPYTEVKGSRWGSDSNTRAFYRALWTEDALYFGFRVEKETFYEYPQGLSTLNNDMIRIYYTLSPVNDYLSLWDEQPSAEAFDRLRLFPHAKRVDGKEFFHTLEDLCQYKFELEEGCWKGNVCIPFAKKKSAGEDIAIGIEVCAVPEAAKRRNCALFLGDDDHASLLSCTPAALLVARLI